MFLPMTKDECDALGWSELDVILLTGDAYVDSSFFGTALIGKYLVYKGFRVGVIAQPDVTSSEDISRLGQPKLFWGVSAGCVDSMVSNYTPLKKRRNEDDLTAGGRNTKRPDRASIVYTNLIRKTFPDGAPVILGGIEASLRRIAHYDYWDDAVRRSILFDAKADAIVYGMGEKTIFELALRIRDGKPWKDLRGICVISDRKFPESIEIPSFEEVSSDKSGYFEMFDLFYQNTDPFTAKALSQKHGDKYLVQNRPQFPLSEQELDDVYNLDFERAAHPLHEKEGHVRALDTIRFSITSHRGCYGECSFCAISAHQGRIVVSRSESSIVKEAETIRDNPGFTGIIHDVGGPTANMYGFECRKKVKSGACRDRRCLFPETCANLKPDHSRQIALLEKIRNIKGVRKVFVASGVRYDLIFADKRNGERYLRELVAHYISGQMKIAPEHTSNHVLMLMGKPGKKDLIRFKEMFDRLNREAGKKQFLTYYFIAAHPGCTEAEMRSCGDFSRQMLKHRPEQVQIFTPTPSTWSTTMYHTGIDPYTGEPLFVEKSPKGKEHQKIMIRGDNRSARPGKKHY
jgi:uncharacterized radical SAM protein YgiQ